MTYWTRLFKADVNNNDSRALEMAAFFNTGGMVTSVALTRYLTFCAWSQRHE